METKLNDQDIIQTRQRWANAGLDHGLLGGLVLFPLLLTTALALAGSISGILLFIGVALGLGFVNFIGTAAYSVGLRDESISHESHMMRDFGVKELRGSPFGAYAWGVWRGLGMHIPMIPLYLAELAIKAAFRAHKAAQNRTPEEKQKANIFLKAFAVPESEREAKSTSTSLARPPRRRLKTETDVTQAATSDTPTQRRRVVGRTEP